jgi:hypothetical protein
LRCGQNKIHRTLSATNEKMLSLRPAPDNNRYTECMDITNFSEPECQALLDLLVLAMYLDGNLAKVEEARVQQLLAAMGFKTEYDRNRQFDVSVTRVRSHSATPEAARKFAGMLAGHFTTADHRIRVYDALKKLTALDGGVSPEENRFLSLVREVFQM